MTYAEVPRDVLTVTSYFLAWNSSCEELSDSRGMLGPLTTVTNSHPQSLTQSLTLFLTLSLTFPSPLRESGLAIQVTDIFTNAVALLHK
jgi:hypothetical protein